MSQENETTIELGSGVEAVVEYSFTPATTGSHDEPPEAAEAEVNAVLINDRDIFEDLSVACISRIENECLQHGLSS